MEDTVLQDVYKRIHHALMLDASEHHQQAYQSYLAITAYISNVLGHKSSESNWCDQDTLKLLNMAKNCIEAASKINSDNLQHRVGESNIPTSPSAQSEVASTCESSELTPDSCHGEDTDLLDILDCLPDVPANKPGQKYRAPIKRSDTSPILPSHTSDPNEPPHANQSTGGGPSQTPPRSQTLPSSSTRPSANVLRREMSMCIVPTAKTHLSNFSASFHQQPSENLKSFSMDRATQQNALIAAKYERRSQRRALRPSERLDMLRAQEENMMLARELDKTLQRKADLRKQRLLEEQEAGQAFGGEVGLFDAILTCKISCLRGLLQEVVSFDAANCWDPGIWDWETDDINKMEKFIEVCLRQSTHPFNKAIGDAQFNFYNRLYPLNKKVSTSTLADRENLSDGIVSELEAINSDIILFSQHLVKVFAKAYPRLNNRDGHVLLHENLTKTLFQPIWDLFLELYNFLNCEDVEYLKSYLKVNHDNDITAYPEIKSKYHLGINPYQDAVQVLKEMTKTTSPHTKLDLLKSFGHHIPTAIKKHYLNQGWTEEDAQDVACMGADDLMPITIYIISRANDYRLFVELKVLTEVLPPEDLMDERGYCLATVLQAIQHLINMHHSPVLGTDALHNL